MYHCSLGMDWFQSSVVLYDINDVLNLITIDNSM